VEALTLR